MSALGNWLARHGLDAEVIRPDHPDYDRRRVVWNAMIDRRPGAIVRPRTAATVANAVRIAAELGCPLEVRGGGHNVAGFSICDHGLVVDLGAMRRVTVDTATRTASVGGGALLADLDGVSEGYGLVTPAGVISHTGVGGLTLGGGMGWLSRRFGMTVDNLVGAELVAADGSIVRTSVDEEPDVFWAIRGGGGNFAVVTTFRFRLHELASVTVADWRYRPADAARVLQSLGELAPDHARELTLSMNLTRAGLGVTACWSGAESAAEVALAPYDRLAEPVQRGIAAMRFIDLQRRHDDLLPWGRRYFTKGGYLRALDRDAVAALATAAADVPGPDSEIYVVQLGGAVADVADEATAFTGRDAEFFWLAQAIWDLREVDDANVAWVRRAAELLTACSSAGNYVNEQSELGRGGVAAAYGAAKHRRLAELKRRYDPDNLFRLNQNIRPAA